MECPSTPIVNAVRVPRLVTVKRLFIANEREHSLECPSTPTAIASNIVDFLYETAAANPKPKCLPAGNCLHAPPFHEPSSCFLWLSVATVYARSKGTRNGAYRQRERERERDHERERERERERELIYLVLLYFIEIPTQGGPILSYLVLGPGPHMYVYACSHT